MQSQSTQGKLQRSLGLWGVVLFGLAYMAPMIVYGTYGVLAQTSQGMVPLAYLLALCAVMLTAISYGNMARAIPVAGSAYTYAGRAIGAPVGFMVGWAVLLDYFFLPMVIWLIGAAYLSQAFPSVPSAIWILVFIVITTGINLLGIVLANRVNIVLMVMQVLIVLGFITLCIHYVVGAEGPGGLVSVKPFFNASVPISAAFSGAAIAAYSFLGFDAVTTLTEETIDPRRTMPRAILLVAVLGGVIFIAAAYFAQLADPTIKFANPDAAAMEIAERVGGDIFAMLFLTGLVVAQFTAGLAAQAAVGRLLFAMGRDGVLPRRVFGYLQPRFKTPAFNIVLSGVIGLAALAMTEETSTSFINFGAFLAFTFVNLSVLTLYIRDRAALDGVGVITGVLVPIAGTIFNLYLLSSLDGVAIELGLSWLVLGAVYLTWLTRGFSQPTPQVEEVID